MRRAIDLIASSIGLMLLSPLFVLAAMAVKFTSEGPVFHRGRRVGRNGTPFLLLKFRTMRHGDPSGPAITRARDPRITPAGRVLRRLKLDELPQLVNVLKGDMSLVGPRPEAEEYVRLYTDAERRVLSVRPGLTSPTSIRFRNEAALLTGPDWHEHYVNVIMREKLREELHYLDRRTFWSDLQVLLRTAAALALPDHFPTR